MKTLIVAATACLALAGCGVDGPPVRPAAAPNAAPPPGITVSGEARIGMRADDL